MTSESGMQRTDSSSEALFYKISQPSTSMADLARKYLISRLEVALSSVHRYSYGKS